MSAKENEVERNEIALWKECTTLQIEMKRLLKGKKDPFCEKIEDLRRQLRENYLYLLSEHSAFCFEDKDVLVNLWKFVFYKQIEFVRKKIRSKQKKDNEEEERQKLITFLTETIIPDAKSVYNDLFIKHLKKAHITRTASNCFVDNLLLLEEEELACLNVSELRLSLMISHKSLIYIGDLERYRDTYLDANYQSAKLSYCLAHQLMPKRGNPHNQLAVLHQMQTDCDLSAIYRYVLSLFVLSPFMTAKENLSLLMNKNISVIDKMTNYNHDSLPKLIQSKNTWNELQTVVIYILGIIYRKNAKYDKVIKQIQPIILSKIRKVLLHNKQKSDNDDDDQKEVKEDENANVIKQICVISIFLVIDCFKNDAKYAGYKAAISWTLSLIAMVMDSLSFSSNDSLLQPIIFCCLWLQNNFDFVVPDINELPWSKMEINQNDLEPNNEFFSQFAKLLNSLHRKYKNDQSVQKVNKDVIIPELIEFYGIKALQFVDFDDDKYSKNTEFIFIYHRRFCAKNKEKITLKSGNIESSQSTNAKMFDYLRYLKLVDFAQYSSKKIEGVLVFKHNKWKANKLLTVEEPQILTNGHSHSAHNPSM